MRRVSFTGHRSSEERGRSAEDLEAVRGLVREQLVASGGKVFCASVAEGADTIACEEALNLGLRLELYLPLPVLEFREDFEDRMEAWPRAERLIEVAGESGEHSLQVLEGERPECYAAVNEVLLEKADLLIAVTMESPERTGGASEMVALARKRRIPCVVIDPLSRTVSSA